MEEEIKFRQFISRVIKIYKPFKKAVFELFLVLLVIEALNLTNPYIYGKIIDGITSHKPITDVMKLLFAVLGIFILRNVMSYIKERIEIYKLDFDVSRFVAMKTLRKFFDFSIGQHENQNSGIKKSIIDKGEHSLTSLAFSFIYEILPVLLRTSVIIILLLVLAPALGIIILIGASIFIALTYYFDNLMRDDMKKHQDNYHEASKRHSEILRNVSLVKTNAKEEKSIEEYNSFLKEIHGFAQKMWMKFYTLAISRTSLLQLTRLSVFAVGIYLVYKGVYTAGFLVTFIYWSGSVFEDFSQLSNIHRRTIEMYSAVKKYFVLLDVESDIKEIENPIIPEKFSGKIEFKNVWFKYPKREYIKEEDKNKSKIKTKKAEEKEKYVLRNINFSVEPGQKVAIVGPSGAGKSTLVHLLIRAYDPSKGSIIIDGNNLKDLGLENFRSAIGMVSQDIALFDNTLRHNIVFGAREWNLLDKELWQAAKMACVDKFIKNLENGFDTIIGERGIKLSGGERQRVGIARALVKNPSILIFDEATSSLDTENEALIRQSIEKASKGRTTIIIAHRLSTIKDADKIIVMEKGRVVGEGKHDDLLQTCETYKRLINNQTVMVGGA